MKRVQHILDVQRKKGLATRRGGDEVVDTIIGNCMQDKVYAYLQNWFWG